MKNLFIALEGIDGSGKSTQANLLTQTLREAGYNVHQTFEPTNRAVGSMIRAILTGKQQAEEQVIAGLFVADRLDHLLNKDDGIVKKINEGCTVVCDRYCFSSYAYQGTHMDMDWVINANAMSASILKPDVNIFIDVPPEECMKRISKNRGQTELYETLENLKKVRSKFFEAFEKMRDKESVVVVNGNQPAQLVAQQLFKTIQQIQSANT